MQLTNLNIKNDFDLLSVSDKNSNIIFQITYDGTIKFRLNGELKEISDEKEISTLFAMVICEFSGIESLSKEELIQRIINNYRNGKIDNLLS